MAKKLLARIEVPGCVWVRIPDYTPCRECNGPAYGEVDTGRTGAGFGVVHDHAPTCSAVICPHGNPWAEPCEACDEAERANVAEEDE